MRITYPSILLLALTIASCGGGGDAPTTPQASTQPQAPSEQPPQSTTPPTQTPPATTPPATTPPSTTPSTTPQTPPALPTNVTRVIEYYGDSTVWGYATGNGSQVAKPAPVAFAEALPTSPRHQVLNEGVSGTTACELLNGTDGKHPNWSTQMAASKAHVVIINHAINDQWKYDLTTYRSCLRTLAQTAKRSGKQVVFETPNPTKDSGPDGLDRYVSAMKDVATQEQVPVIDQYKYLTDYLAGRSPYVICPDGWHPTDSVYVMKGRYAASVFVKLYP